ncbi:MAG: hypothetical protein V1489_00490 [Candidatus Liptonbacteria bacterium]
MNYRKLGTSAALFLAGAAIVASSVSPAFAETTSTRSSSTMRDANGANSVTREANLKNRADREIARRITSLNVLRTRIQAMQKLSASQKSGLAASIQSQIDELNALKSKIDADTDLTTLQNDVKSITASYRTYMLVMPQITVIAAADRALATADTLAALSTKLETRINDTNNAGKDVSSLRITLADLNAKIADARTQANAAISAVQNLTPDQGDQGKAQANASALKDARAKVRAAREDLVTARKDAGNITRGLRSINGNSSSTDKNSSSSEDH